MTSNIDCGRMLRDHPQGKFLTGIIFHDDSKNRWVELVIGKDSPYISGTRIDVPDGVTNVNLWFQEEVLMLQPYPELCREAEKEIADAIRRMKKKHSSLIRKLKLEDWEEFRFLTCGEIHIQYATPTSDGAVLEFKWDNFVPIYNTKTKKFFGIVEPYTQMFSVLEDNRDMIEAVEKLKLMADISDNVTDFSFKIDYKKPKISLSITYSDCTTAYKILPETYKDDLQIVLENHKKILKNS